MLSIKQWIASHKQFVSYFLISVFVTIVDIIVSRISERFLDVVVANTIGVVSGFVIQYILCTRKVYNGSNIRTAVIFFLTWLFGLALADIIVYIVRIVIFGGREGILYYFIGKGFSVALPFFVTYFIRKKLIPAKQE